MSKNQIEEIRSKIINLEGDIRVITNEKEQYEEEHEHYKHDMDAAMDTIEGLRQQISTLKETLEHQDKDNVWSQKALHEIESYNTQIREQEQRKISVLGHYNKKNREITNCEEKIKGKKDEIESLRAILKEAGVH
ncbi:hypothetical protein RF11_00487 [Thelohanellus kitauei]|uniref:Uncharacterized protein n=1 Tax=Thelohanellus kitauei TaxID=669202 RepID=A0A0C2N3Z3_THEKT|nr:hypothetical protein RF11_00487 [Thelohanellus kitauei]